VTPPILPAALPSHDQAPRTFEDKATRQDKKGASTIARSRTRNVRKAEASHRAAETLDESPKYCRQAAESEGREAAAPAAGASAAPAPTTKAAPAAVNAAFSFDGRQMFLVVL
jgi:hypothetical protein